MKISKDKQKQLDKHKKKVNDKFETLKYKQDVLEQGIMDKNEQLLHKLEEHDKNVEETRKNLQHVIRVKEERDRLKKNDQLENFSR